MNFLDKLGDVAYPLLTIPHNEKPSRFYAVPVLGILAKIVMLIPVSFIIMILGLVAFFAVLINVFVVLFTGHYWRPAYNLLLDLARRNVNISSFVYGLTDKYPGFTSELLPGMTFEMPYPASSNRMYAIPLLGLMLRLLLGIPLILLMMGFGYVSGFVFLVMWIPVLFTGKYPLIVHNFLVEQIRFGLSYQFFFTGIADKPPRLEFSFTKERLLVYILMIVGLLSIFQQAKSAENMRNNPYMNGGYGNNMMYPNGSGGAYDYNYGNDKNNMMPDDSGAL